MKPRTEKPAWVDPNLFPFSTYDAELAEGAMSYVDEGEGPTLLLVHGTPGWSFEFRSVVPLLSDSFRVLAPDLLGFGLSDRVPGGDYTVSAHARRLAAFLDQLDLRDVHLVLHDFGGPIGLGATLERPDRVRSITVANTWAWPLNGDPTFERTRWLTGSVGRFLYERLNFSARVLVPQAFADRKHLSRSVHRHYVEAQDPPAREAAFTFARELLGAREHLERLVTRRDVLAPRIRSVVWGMADRLLPAELFLPRWKEHFPDAEQIGLDGVGHYVQEEAPERLADIVRRTQVATT